jgi:general secretion pathway protein A
MPHARRRQNRRMLSPPSQTDSLTYEGFFGLHEKPFSLSSDPKFLYHSRSHALAFDDLLTGIRRREGLMVLTGDIGTGKTTLCRAALESLDRKTFVAFVRDPFASREDLLKMLLIDFGVMSISDLTTGPLKGASRTELSYLLSAFLQTLVSLEAFVVVLIDEAQNMSLPLIEEIRILSDTYSNTSLLQIVFVGQLELLAKLKLPEMRQVEQRVCVHARLDPLTDDAVPGYVRHRLQIAGGTVDRVRFGSEALDVLARGSHGVPRLINRVCDRALYLAYLKRSAVIDALVMQGALDYVGLSDPSAAPAGTGDTSTGVDTVMSAPTAAPPVGLVADQPVAPPGFLVPAAAPLGRGDPVDEWLSRVEGPAKPEAAVQQFVSEGTEDSVVTTAPGGAPTVLLTPLRPRPPRRTHWRDGSGAELRSQTYMQGLRRRVIKNLSIAAVLVIGISGVVAGVSYIPDALAALSDPVTVPTPPAVVPVTVPAVLAAPVPTIPLKDPAKDAAIGAGAGAFRVDVALFSSDERANRAVAELIQAGLAARQQPLVLGARGTLQQVILGPFETRGDADTQLRRLRQVAGYGDARVVAQGSREK